MYLRGGVSERERIETSLSNEMAIIGISYLKKVLMNYAVGLLALELQDKLSALKVIQEPVSWTKFQLVDTTAEDSECSNSSDKSSGIIERIPTWFKCCC